MGHEDTSPNLSVDQVSSALKLNEPLSPSRATAGPSQPGAPYKTANLRQADNNIATMETVEQPQTDDNAATTEEIMKQPQANDNDNVATMKITEQPQANDNDVTKEIVEQPQADDNIATTQQPQTNAAEPNLTEANSTNLLLSLPPEILEPIFSLVGIENFRQDGRRLRVCKKWYEYARPILLGSVRLWSEDTYHMYLMIRYTKRGRKLKAVKQMVKQFELTIDTRWFENKTGWYLDMVGDKLKELDALRTLVIRPGEWELSLPTGVFSRFVSVRQLTTLDIDLSNVNLWMIGQNSDRVSPHLCDLVSQLIPTLKRLRYRMSRVCSNLLQSPPGDLEELIFCMSPVPTFNFHPRHCYTGDKFDDEDRAAFEERLVQFAASMHEPKMVRLVHCFQYAHKTYAFDAINQQRFFLGCDPAWDADGELLPEDWEESDEESEEDEENEESDDHEEVSDDEARSE